MSGARRSGHAALRAVALPTILLAGGLGLYAHTFAGRDVRVGIGDPFGPVFYPRLLLGALVLLSAIALLQGLLSLRRDGTPDASPEAGASPAEPGTAAAVIGACLAFLVLSYAVGFLAGSIVFYLLCALAFGYRRPLILLPVALLMPWATWYLFHHLIQIRLPAGIWPIGG